MDRDDAFITYIPATAVAKLKEPSVIISIKGRYDTRPELNEKHTVFKLDFDVGDWARDGGHLLKPEQIDELFKFVDSVKGRDIFIHCTEGRCRSHTIAKLLRAQYRKDYYLQHHDLSNAEGQWIDRPTCGIWHDHIEKLELEELRQADSKVTASE